jgi:hypothetical protein
VDVILIAANATTAINKHGIIIKLVFFLKLFEYAIIMLIPSGKRFCPANVQLNTPPEMAHADRRDGT